METKKCSYCKKILPVDMFAIDRQKKSGLTSRCKDCIKLTAPREKRNAELEKENAELKILVSSMLYEINALWDISEMNEDVRKHAERIDSEVEK